MKIKMKCLTLLIYDLEGNEVFRKSKNIYFHGNMKKPHIPKLVIYHEMPGWMENLGDGIFENGYEWLFKFKSGIFGSYGNHHDDYDYPDSDPEMDPGSDGYSDLEKDPDY